MTTVTQVRDRCQARLLGEHTEQIDRLNGAVSNTTTETLTVEFEVRSIGPGAVIEIDSELMYVTGRTGTTVSVLRGFRGTTAATHADNAIITVNPRWPLSDLVAIMEEELRSWPLQLGGVRVVEIVVGAGEYLVEIPDDSLPGPITRVLDAQLLSAVGTDFPQRNRIDVALIHDADLDEFGSGYAIQLQQPVDYDQVVQLTYLHEYTMTALATGSTDLETTVGLRPSVVDILIYGVMWRSMSTREVGRTDSAAVASSTAERVPPTHLIQAGEALRQIRDQRLQDEMMRMNDLYPVLMSTAQG